ncbi:hypothetical protein GA707_07555 [Nostocoides sp. F2B08]|uniref:DUF6448 family protein n=1 Tax=Nostocoides sp. F2B08 TaxID=2653936 RepID=UPI001262D8F8|nr:DUF6448 family protein [Tetrasphaera sp. F2B08]KAB7744469.1 hypothetical protein GA707_07555 [Tetrasphaera sp. F2B08]
MNIAKVLRLFVRTASAHCDTEDGPAVGDGRRALESGNVNIALKWVHQDAEEEVREAFTRAVAVRDLSPQARDLADRYFLDVLIRVHRAGEGAGFEGIKPAGAHVPPQVVAAEEALSLGRIDPLRGLVDDDRWDELERRFDQAVALKGFDVDNLAAAREYVAAYVSFFKFAEGHDQEHDHQHAHVH